MKFTSPNSISTFSQRIKLSNRISGHEKRIFIDEENTWIDFFGKWLEIKSNQSGCHGTWHYKQTLEKILLYFMQNHLKWIEMTCKFILFGSKCRKWKNAQKSFNVALKFFSLFSLSLPLPLSLFLLPFHLNSSFMDFFSSNNTTKWITNPDKSITITGNALAYHLIQFS